MQAKIGLSEIAPDEDEKPSQAPEHLDEVLIFGTVVPSRAWPEVAHEPTRPMVAAPVPSGGGVALATRPSTETATEIPRVDIDGEEPVAEEATAEVAETNGDGDPDSDDETAEDAATEEDLTSEADSADDDAVGDEANETPADETADAEDTDDGDVETAPSESTDDDEPSPTAPKGASLLKKRNDANCDADE